MVGAAARGAGLIALAVGIGLVLMQFDGDGDTRLAANRRSAGSATTTAAEEKKPARSTSTSSTSSTSTSTSTTTTTVAAVPPADVTVLVLNGTEKPNQARPLSARLAEAGYQTLTPSDAPRTTQSLVLCRPEVASAAPALVAATGLPATPGELGDPSDLPGAAGADCVVVIGAP